MVSFFIFFKIGNSHHSNTGAVKKFKKYNIFEGSRHKLRTIRNVYITSMFCVMEETIQFYNSVYLPVDMSRIGKGASPSQITRYPALVEGVCQCPVFESNQ